MNIIDLKCSKSLVFSGRYFEGVEESNLRIGSTKYFKYKSYLYFDLTPIPSTFQILSARLILYKIPKKNNNLDCVLHNLCEYAVVPTLDYVSRYSYIYSDIIEIDRDLVVDFSIDRRLAYTEIDITTIVNYWIKGKVENKGIIITGKEHSLYQEYGSPLGNNSERPYLRVESRSCIPIPPGPTPDGPVIELPVSIEIIE